MFKVGDYYEDEAKTVASYLRDAGFKVDIKGLVVARTDFTASLQGRISELKERGKHRCQPGCGRDCSIPGEEGIGEDEGQYHKVESLAELEPARKDHR